MLHTAEALLQGGAGRPRSYCNVQNSAMVPVIGCPVQPIPHLTIRQSTLSMKLFCLESRPDRFVAKMKPGFTSLIPICMILFDWILVRAYRIFTKDQTWSHLSPSSYFPIIADVGFFWESLVYPKLASNSLCDELQILLPPLFKCRITGMHYHTQFYARWAWNPGLCAWLS